MIIAAVRSRVRRMALAKTSRSYYFNVETKVRKNVRASSPGFQKGALKVLIGFFQNSRVRTCRPP